MVGILAAVCRVSGVGVDGLFWLWLACMPLSAGVALWRVRTSPAPWPAYARGLVSAGCGLAAGTGALVWAAGSQANESFLIILAGAVAVLAGYGVAGAVVAAWPHGRWWTAALPVAVAGILWGAAAAARWYFVL